MAELLNDFKRLLSERNLDLILEILNSTKDVDTLVTLYGLINEYSLINGDDEIRQVAMIGISNFLGLDPTMQISREGGNFDNVYRLLYALFPHYLSDRKFMKELKESEKDALYAYMEDSGYVYDDMETKGKIIMDLFRHKPSVKRQLPSVYHRTASYTYNVGDLVDKPHFISTSLMDLQSTNFADCDTKHCRMKITLPSGDYSVIPLFMMDNPLTILSYEVLLPPGQIKVNGEDDDFLLCTFLPYTRENMTIEYLKHRRVEQQRDENWIKPYEADEIIPKIQWKYEKFIQWKDLRESLYTSSDNVYTKFIKYEEFIIVHPEIPQPNNDEIIDDFGKALRYKDLQTIVLMVKVSKRIDRYYLVAEHLNNYAKQNAGSAAFNRQLLHDFTNNLQNPSAAEAVLDMVKNFDTAMAICELVSDEKIRDVVARKVVQLALGEDEGDQNIPLMHKFLLTLFPEYTGDIDFMKTLEQEEIDTLIKCAGDLMQDNLDDLDVEIIMNLFRCKPSVRLQFKPVYYITEDRKYKVGDIIETPDIIPVSLIDTYPQRRNIKITLPPAGYSIIPLFMLDNDEYIPFDHDVILPPGQIIVTGEENDNILCKYVPGKT